MDARKKPEQTGFFFDAPTDPVSDPVSVIVDFGAMAPGTMVGNRWRVMVCPVCQKNAARKAGEKAVVYVHAAHFTANNKSETRYRPAKACRISRELDPEAIRILEANVRKGVRL